MRLILHIGNHKAGSSTIQTGLLEKQEELLNFSVLYPKTALVICAHHNLAFALKGQAVGFRSRQQPKSLSDYKLQVAEEAKKHNVRTVVMSSEEFMKFNEQDITVFSDFCSLFDSVKIIAYFRDHVNSIESSYKFSILWDATSETKPFDTWIKRVLDSGYHQYDKMIEPWFNVHKNTEIFIKNFHSEVKAGILEGFFNELGVGNEPKLFMPNKKYNSSLTRLGSLLVRANNREQSIKKSDLVTQIRLLEDKRIFSDQEKLYTPMQMEKIIQRFQPSNKRLIEYFGVDVSFKEAQLSLQLCKGDDFLDSDLLKMISRD
ncbi:MAG: hypothetical protein KZQ58_05225 [gamma proteobacterium symbiont of Bathyaustriella thionipta]|nr:hypothetical protein [gamma proteobacterium symbiont of Bathyaustriella thionipta]